MTDLQAGLVPRALPRRPLVLSVLAWVARSLAATSIAGALFAADDSNDGPPRFHDVKAWRGRITATATVPREARAQLEGQWNPQRGAKWNFDFTMMTQVEFFLNEYEDDPSVWRGKVKSATFEVSYHYDVTHPDDYSFTTRNSNHRFGHREFDWNIQGGGPLKFERDGVELQFHRERGWSVRLSSGAGSASYTARRFHRAPRESEQNPSHDFIIDRDRLDHEAATVKAFGMGNTQTFPYPAKGLTLSARNQVMRLGFPVSGGTPGFTPGVEWTYSVELEPADMKELRVEIDDTPAYQSWRPSAQRDGSAGAPLEITARVVTKEGKVPQAKVTHFEWNLVGTSREPGIAMNYPLTAPPRLDLELAGTGGLVDLRDEKQTLVRAVERGNTDTVTVVPFDWGGWSTLRVIATLEDGRRLVGQLKGSNENDLRLPKRAADSHIADAWRKAKGSSGKDATDDENDPVGTKGDGFTLYQEYRGFYEGGSHIEGDPRRKDLFIQTQRAPLAIPGIALFQRITRLAVHHKLTDEEFDRSRIMNLNRRAGAHVASQHGILMRIDPTLSGVSRAVGGPANPKYVTEVRLLAEAAQMDPQVLKSTVAHELGHCINLYHHGEADAAVTWKLEGRFIREYRSGAATGSLVLGVMNENWDDLTQRTEEILRDEPGNVLTFWKGFDQGQHSGHDNCIMRYDCAQAYGLRTATATTVIGFDEPSGFSLCPAPKGVGVNGADRNPQSRYGDAASGRGACREQILVNDAVEPPKR